MADQGEAGSSSATLRQCMKLHGGRFGFGELRRAFLAAHRIAAALAFYLAILTLAGSAPALANCQPDQLRATTM